MEAETKQVILTQKVSKGSFQIARDELGELKFALQCTVCVLPKIFYLASPLFTFSHRFCKHMS